jgi:succinate-semialdehyde dehydrogenase / glutarate-semialdehyde dehydrogenase
MHCYTGVMPPTVLKRKTAMLVSTNPAKNYEEIGSVEISSDAEIAEKVERAQKAKKEWKKLGVSGRIAALQPLLEAFRSKKDALALLATREIGKPISEASADLEWDLGYFAWFLENGKKALAEEITQEDEQALHTIVYDPIGVAAVIAPWNFPFGNFLWGVIPNLIAGNTVVMKHSEECPLSGKLMEEVVNTAALPEGVFAEVYGDGKVGRKLVEHDIDLIWFTGSSATGQTLYEIAAKKMIKALLEMGGSSPAIVFGDVALDRIAGDLAGKRLLNCGQCCDGMKRLIVHEMIFDAVVGRLKEEFEKQVVGDPEDPKTTIGSLVAKRQLRVLQEQVEDAKKKGATVVTGGRSPAGLQGAYYLPTLLTNITPDMRGVKKCLALCCLSCLSARKNRRWNWLKIRSTASVRRSIQLIPIAHCVWLRS